MIGAAKRLFHKFRHLAAIDGAAKNHFKGHLISPDQIATPYLQPVDAKMSRDMVHQTFHDVIGLGPSSTTIGVNGGRIGHHTKHAKACRPDGVGRRQRPAARQCRDVGAEVRQPRTHIGVNRDRKRVNPAIIVNDSA